MGLISEKFFAYALAVVLMVVGVVCYAAFAHKGPEEPIRIMLKATAGNVLFDHKQHTSADGYGYADIGRALNKAPSTILRGLRGGWVTGEEYKPRNLKYRTKKVKRDG